MYAVLSVCSEGSPCAGGTEALYNRTVPLPAPRHVQILLESGQLTFNWNAFLFTEQLNTHTQIHTHRIFFLERFQNKGTILSVAEYFQEYQIVSEFQDPSNSETNKIDEI